MEEEKTIRVMLVDDHPVMREGLAALLNRNSDITLVGEAEDGAQAIDLARETMPDVIIMDINMPNMNGIEATRIIHEEFPRIRIIGLSMHESDMEIDQMFQAGASAYRSKGDATDLLIADIRKD